MMQLVEEGRALYPLIADGDISLFAKWLTDRGYRLAGFPFSPHNCPLANWLTSRFGTQDVEVGFHSVRLGHITYEIPEWMTRFQSEACDMLRLTADHYPFGFREQSGDACLAILREVEGLAATAT